MRETQIVDRIRKRAETSYLDRAVIQGIGDDCAILRPRAKDDLVLTSDLLIQDRHFTREIYSPADIGHKALARSLSDLAAMGAEPVFCLVSLAIPDDLTGSWLNRFYKGLLALAAKHNTTLAGGDLSRFDHIVADVMCCGRVPRGKALLRSTAKPGDSIYVTGTLGKSWQRNRRPEPRIEAGIALRRLGVRAAMDLSDGLSLDLHRLCLESHVSAEITADLSEQALHGGEDYELLFTAPTGRRVPSQIAGVPVTQIGQITRGREILVRNLKGIANRLEPRGWEHFRR
jgi:thiamine-monophosphate kinase